jgi:hypothetical protein
VIATLEAALEVAVPDTRRPGILLNSSDATYREGEYLVVTAMSSDPRTGYP